MLNLILKLLGKRHLTSSEAYANWLRGKGCKIGENFKVYQLLNGGWQIDYSRPSLIEIGDNVTINTGCKLLTHDFVSGVFLNLYHEFLPSSGKIKIGNNVRLGKDVMILKGVTIGDNVFIGAGSIVTKDIPSNCVAVGQPAKMICTIKDYFEKRKEQSLIEAFKFVKAIRESGREPRISDFVEEFPFFVDSENIDDYPEINIKQKLKSHYGEWLKKHKRIYATYADFLKAADYYNYHNSILNS